MMALFFRVPLQVHTLYEAAAAEYEIVMTAEALVMPRNWIKRVGQIKRYMELLALMDAGDTARYRELEREANRLMRVNYGTVSKLKTYYAYGGLGPLFCVFVRMLIAFHLNTHTDIGHRRFDRPRHRGAWDLRSADAGDGREGTSRTVRSRGRQPTRAASPLILVHVGRHARVSTYIVGKAKIKRASRARGRLKNQ